MKFIKYSLLLLPNTRCRLAVTVVIGNAKCTKGSMPVLFKTAQPDSLLVLTIYCSFFFWASCLSAPALHEIFENYADDEEKKNNLLYVMIFCANAAALVIKLRRKDRQKMLFKWYKFPYYGTRRQRFAGPHTALCHTSIFAAILLYFSFISMLDHLSLGCRWFSTSGSLYFLFHLDWHPQIMKLAFKNFFLCVWL